MTVGSKSTKTALGTCFPELVSLKKVLKESSISPMESSDGIWPSGWIPCSRQYNSQHALPIWMPAWPTWTDRTSRIFIEKWLIGFKKVLMWIREWFYGNSRRWSRWLKDKYVTEKSRKREWNIVITALICCYDHQNVVGLYTKDSKRNIYNTHKWTSIL